MTLFLTKSLYFITKNSFISPFLVSFPGHPLTLLLQILGGRMHGPFPYLKFWGRPSPQSPKSPPMQLHQLMRNNRGCNGGWTGDAIRYLITKEHNIASQREKSLSCWRSQRLVNPTKQIQPAIGSNKFPILSYSHAENTACLE